jgi:hypothetical protein
MRRSAAATLMAVLAARGESGDVERLAFFVALKFSSAFKIMFSPAQGVAKGNGFRQ